MIAEDSALIAAELQTIATEIGLAVAAVVRTQREALEALSDAQIDIAIVDFWLEDGPSDALADQLEERAIPTVIISAAYIDELPLPTNLRRILPKPFSMTHLIEAVDLLTGKR